MKNKYLLGILLKVTLLTLVFVLAYFFLFLKPKLSVPNALIDAERSLSTHYYTLLQNRLSLTQLPKIDHDSTNFDNERTEIISILQKTNEDGLKALADQQKPKSLNGAPSEVLTFLNNDLKDAQIFLFERNKNFYEGQKKIINELITFDASVSDIFSYEPETDIGSLDDIIEKEEELERIANAKKGINKAKNTLSQYDRKNDQMIILNSGIDKIIDLLTQLEKNLQIGNYQGSQSIKNSLYNQFSEVKRQAFDTELSIIKSNESVKLLADETNLLMEYEYWLGKIKDYQKGF